MPQHLARRRLEGDQIGGVVGIHSVQNFDEEHAVVEQGRRGIAPHQAKSTVLLLQAIMPQFLSFHIIGLDHACARNSDHHFAIGDRRRRGIVVLHPIGIALVEGALPQDAAVDRRQTAQQQLFAALDLLTCIRRSQKNAVTPDHGRTPAPRGQLLTPNDIFLHPPSSRQIDGLATAVEIGTTPLRPVFLIGAEQRRRYQQ